jgi:hypothetical protein
MGLRIVMQFTCCEEKTQAVGGFVPTVKFVRLHWIILIDSPRWWIMEIDVAKVNEVMRLNKQSRSLWDDVQLLDLGNSGARIGEYKGKPAMYLERAGAVVLSRDHAPFEHYRLEADVAIPQAVGFVGLVFHARDADNYELIYLAPEEIQYDPIMNGSMTWQIYNGPHYQKPLPNTTGRWRKLAVEVHPDQASVYLDDDPAPQLIITRLQHGGTPGKIGFWGYLPGYIRNLTMQELSPETKNSTVIVDNSMSGFLTNWLVSPPYSQGEQPVAKEHWTEASVEQHGTLNINRIYQAGLGATIQAQTELHFPTEQKTMLSLGYSDELRLWINEKDVYHGSWRWNPPTSDGRIRSDHISLPIYWSAGMNIVRTELTNKETFGWGLACRILQNHT